MIGSVRETKNFIVFGYAMKIKRDSQHTQKSIFEASSAILIREGLTNLTLQAVANEAKVSKGGLLYHFRTKEALIEALFEYHNNLFEDRLQELIFQEGDLPGAYLRAYAKASVEQMSDPANAKLYASLFAAEEKYPNAHLLMRKKYVGWQEKIDRCGLDQDMALLLRFAVDGLWFSIIHQYAPPIPDRREKILEMILELTHRVEKFGI